jgi:hypothetical protein
MAEPLSFEADIAPLKQLYFQRVFSDPNIRPATAAALSSQFSADIDKSFAQRQEIQDRNSALRGRNLQYETAKFELERAREAAARERNQLAEFAPFAQQLDAIIKDPNRTEETKLRDLGLFGAQQAPYIANNKVAGFSFDAARMAITRDKPAAPKFTIGSIVGAGSDASYLKQLSRFKGQPDSALTADVELTPLEVSEVQRLQLQAVAGGKQQTAAAKQQQIALESLLKSAEAAEFVTFGNTVTDEFTNPSAAESIRTLVGIYGSPEDVEKAKDAKGKSLLELGVPIIRSLRKQQLSGTGAAQPNEAAKTKSLFAE